MATDYTEFVTMAQEMIAEDGRSVTLQRLSVTPVDSNKPWDGPTTPTVQSSETLSAVFVSPSGLGRDIVREDFLSKVEQVVLVAPSTNDLEIYHVLLDAAVRWRIEWMQVLKPGSTTLLYIFGVTR